jgi:hypothetical protein
MKQHLISKAMAVLVLGAILNACGGGGSTPAQSSGATLSGTAATGAPFSGAAVTITDRTGAVVGSGTTGPDGSYSITLLVGAAAPFVLQAVRDDLTLVSVAPDAGTSTINITPITNLIASRLSQSGDPAKLASEVQANPAILSSVQVSAKVDEIIALLKPLLDAVGATANPLTGKFAADGTGIDRALDSLSIKIIPSGPGTSNIEVAIKQAVADGAQPALVQFTNQTATLTPVPAPTALVPSGTAVLIADLLQRMTACFALPVAERVNTPDPTNASPGSAADITAPKCKAIFFNNDPSTFLSNGRSVASNGAFAGLFRTAGTGVAFDRGTYEFTRNNSDSTNGDLVIGYRSTDPSGNVTNDTFAVRQDNPSAPAKLQLIGNQYTYDGAIKSYHQLRTFVNQPSSDYYSTGYVPAVENTLNAGTPIFSKVVVTSPKGGVLTLKPKAGFGSLQLVKAAGTPGEVVTGTSFVRIRSEYVDPSKAADDPATADTQLFFTATKPDDAEIASYGQQSVWKFDYYLAADPTVIAKTQTYRTRARALSISELKQKALANLAPEVVTELVSLTSVNGYFSAPTTEPVTLDWVVPTGSLAPTSLAVWGFRSGAGFNDSSIVGTAARMGTVRCVKKTAADAHCTGTTVGQPSDYASGSQLNGLHLFGRDPAGREYAHFYATYLIGANGE